MNISAYSYRGVSEKSGLFSPFTHMIKIVLHIRFLLKVITRPSPKKCTLCYELKWPVWELPPACFSHSNLHTNNWNWWSLPECPQFHYPIPFLTRSLGKVFLQNAGFLSSWLFGNWSIEINVCNSFNLHIKIRLILYWYK